MGDGADGIVVVSADRLQRHACFGAMPSDWSNTMRDADDLVERLQSIEEELRDLAYERLRAATEQDDAEALADEKKVLQARRAVERAIVVLGGDSGPE